MLPSVCGHICNDDASRQMTKAKYLYIEVKSESALSVTSYMLATYYVLEAYLINAVPACREKNASS